LPLTGAALSLSALALLARPLPPLLATLALSAALAGGLAALAGYGLLLALWPLLLGGVAAMVAALHRGALPALLAGLLLAAAALAFAGAGLALPGLILLAASLTGFALQKRVSSKSAGLAWFSP